MRTIPMISFFPFLRAWAENPASQSPDLWLSELWANKFVGLKICTYLFNCFQRQSERDKQIVRSPIHWFIPQTPAATKAGSGRGQGSELDLDLSHWQQRLKCWIPGYESEREWNRKQSCDSNSGTSVWHVGSPRSTLTASLNAGPKLGLFKSFFVVIDYVAI